MSKQNTGGQFNSLGKQLKNLRARANESLAEVSGAVEIDVQDLASYELGRARPSEEVLLLLISHLGARDDEALRLWEMAGYSTVRTPISHMASSDRQSGLDQDSRILFTDSVDIIVNNYGVVMNFMQTAGPNQPPQNVARVGMSREHAKSVLQILKMTLEQTEPREQQRKTSYDSSGQ